MYIHVAVPGIKCTEDRSSELIQHNKIVYDPIQVTHCVHGFRYQSVLKF